MDITRDCYDKYGYPNDQHAIVVADQARQLDLICSQEPEARVTYHPQDEVYVVHVWGRELSGYMKTRGTALADAITRMNLIATV